MPDINFKIVCTLLGGLVGWFLNQLRLSAEIGKLKAEKNKLKQETIKFAGENLSKVQEKREAYDKACENCKQIALKLCEAIKNQVDTIANIREELCTALYNKAFPLYLNLIEWEQLLSKDNPEKLKKLIAEEVVAELRRFRQWVQMINHEKFTVDMQLSRSKVSKRTLSPFLLMLDDLPSKDRDVVEILLRNTISELINEGI
jgi:hypothetical protein